MAPSQLYRELTSMRSKIICRIYSAVLFLPDIVMDVSNKIPIAPFCAVYWYIDISMDFVILHSRDFKLHIISRCLFELVRFSIFNLHLPPCYNVNPCVVVIGQFRSLSSVNSSYSLHAELSFDVNSRCELQIWFFLSAHNPSV